MPVRARAVLHCHGPRLKAGVTGWMVGHAGCPVSFTRLDVDAPSKSGHDGSGETYINLVMPGLGPGIHVKPPEQLLPVSRSCQ